MLAGIGLGDSPVGMLSAAASRTKSVAATISSPSPIRFWRDPRKRTFDAFRGNFTGAPPRLVPHRQVDAGLALAPSASAEAVPLLDRESDARIFDKHVR
jgi:hypothetical protein